MDSWMAGMDEALRAKLDACRTRLRELRRVVVAFSAGADSTFLLALAAEVLGKENVLDVWFERTVKPRMKGQAFLIRFADDFVMGFSSEEDARRVPLAAWVPELDTLFGPAAVLSASKAKGGALGVPDRSESMIQGAGCGNSARPDLWGTGAGHRPGLPDHPRGILGMEYLRPRD